MAARILPSAHTNPIFVLVETSPSGPRESARWCANAVHQCWTQKAPHIAPGQLAAARAAYEHASEVYKQLEAESN